MAVGLSIEESKFQKFKEKIIDLAKKIDPSKKKKIIEIEQLVNIDEITKKDVESLKRLEPFGEGNRTPCFAFENLKIDSIRSLTEGKHLKLALKDNNNNYIDAIGFNLGELAEEFKLGDRVDLAGTLEINSFNGLDNIQINLKDVKKV